MRRPLAQSLALSDERFDLFGELGFRFRELKSGDVLLS